MLSKDLVVFFEPGERAGAPIELRGGNGESEIAVGGALRTVPDAAALSLPPSSKSFPADDR